jgi:hypothetical protein
VLSEAVSEIDRYLDPKQPFAGIYGYEGEPLFDRVMELRGEMDALRSYLDNPASKPFAQGSDLTAVAEMRATLFLVGLGAGMCKRDEAIAHNAYVCGWLGGVSVQTKGKA